MSRYASSVKGRAVLRGGAGWVREVTAAQELGGGGRVEVAAAAVTLWRGGWGVHAGEGRCAGFGVKAATQLRVSLVFSRGRGVGRPCLGLECPSLCDVRCGGGFELRDGGVETVGSPHQSTAAKFVFIFRQLGRAAVGGLLGHSKAGLDSVKGDPGEVGL